MINIPRTIEDSGYRYQMHVLKQRVIGKGINIRTEIINLKEIAFDLKTELEYIIKFMGIEFGTRPNLIRDKNTNEVQVTSINGNFPIEDVNKVLDKFIDIYIICPKDKYAEVIIDVTNGEVIGKCAACGLVQDITKRHKLSNYIKNHPPKRQQFQKNKEIQIEQNKQTPITFLKYQIREELENNKLEIYSDKEIFIKIAKYFSNFVDFENYEYDDSDTENLYKAVKRMRLKKEMYDRVGFCIFQFIFSENILKEIKPRGILFEQFLERHRMINFLFQEIILNLSYFCYERFEEKNWDKFVPTILKLFLDEKLVTDEKLIQWGEKDDDLFQYHCLYKKENMEKLRTVAAPFLEWLAPSSDESETD